jgi:hypothetical protein
VLLFSAYQLYTCRTQAADAVPKLLGGACKLCTSRCVLEELRSLGDQFSGAQHHVIGRTCPRRLIQTFTSASPRQGPGNTSLQASTPVWAAAAALLRSSRP